MSFDEEASRRAVEGMSEYIWALKSLRISVPSIYVIEITVSVAFCFLSMDHVYHGIDFMFTEAVDALSHEAYKIGKLF